MKQLLKICISLQLIILAGADKIYSQVDSTDITHISSITVNIESPVRLAIDNSGNIYATDSYNDNIVVFDASGNLLDVITSVKSPLSVAINRANQLFVGEGESGDIIKIGINGDSSVFYSGCLMPSSMVFGVDSLLYVVDTKKKNVIALDISANVVKTFGEGTLLLPTSIVYDDRNSRILVGEHGGIGTGFSSICKVWIFDLQGNLIGSIGSNGNADGQFYRIQGLAIGRCGNIYVCDPFQARISIFDENGNFITKFGKFGNMPDEINMPLDIAIDSNKQIIVSSLNKGTLEVYAISDTLPSSNIKNSDATICTGSQTDILIDFTGTAPWTFTYSIDGVDQPPVTTSVTPYALTVSNGGLYEVSSLFDANYTGSCFSGSARVNVISELPSSNISSADTAVCSGQSTNIVIGFTGTSPWNFIYTVDGITPTSISTANNPYVLNTAIDGLYEVIAISDAGCVGTTFTGTANVVVNNLPSSSFTNGNSIVEICEGSSTDLPIDFTGTAPWTFTYEINGEPTVVNTNSSLYVIPATVSGTYLLTELSDSVCTGTNFSGSTNVVVNSVPSVSLTAESDFICTGGSAELKTNFTGQGPWSISYTANGTGLVTINNILANPFTFPVPQAAVYEIVAVSDANCASTDFSGNVSIGASPLPSSNISTDNITICEGWLANIPIDFTGTAPWSFTYTVDGLNPVTMSSANSQFILNTAVAGLYEITAVSDASCNGITFNGAADVVVNNLPTSSFTNGNSTVEICEGSAADLSVDFTGTAPWNFTYTVDGAPTVVNTNSTPYTIPAAVSGAYLVTALSDSICVGTSFLGSANVVVNRLPVIDLGVDVDICENETVTIDAGATFASYLWGDGSTNQTLVTGVSGNYSVLVIDDNGCENSDEIFVSVNPLPFSEFTYILDGQEASFINNSLYSNSYLWNFGDKQTSTEIDPAHVYESSGIYPVTLTASSEFCGDNIFSANVTVVALFVENVGSEIHAKIYPNPTNGGVTIEINKQVLSDLTLEIISTKGQRIFYKVYETQQAVERLDLSGFPAGIYTIKISSGNFTKINKLILY